jgi:hypothetical protein
MLQWLKGEKGKLPADTLCENRREDGGQQMSELSLSCSLSHHQLFSSRIKRIKRFCSSIWEKESLSLFGVSPVDVLGVDLPT